ncbi:jg19148 [Pararge aegeria aegeria]|uniref:Jg19148 protein n=1 Tax=Pararge aegeria aegeria TaxID=348720 RepID=A0A8S4QQT6_9NEOP|nr:jg19148 [Pararge aegeria aegeria]
MGTPSERPASRLPSRKSRVTYMTRTGMPSDPGAVRGPEAAQGHVHIPPCNQRDRTAIDLWGGIPFDLRHRWEDVSLGVRDESLNDAPQELRL